MKKSKLLLIFSCVGLLSVTACNNQAPTSSDGSSSLPPEPPVVPTENIKYSDDALLTDALLQNNSREKDVVKNRKVKNVKLTPAKESFKAENIIRNEASSGLLVVKNDEGYVGFYSLLHHGWLIKPSFEEGKFSYRFKPLSYINYILEIHYKDTYVILDAFGNILDEENRPYSSDQAQYYYYDDEYGEFAHHKMRTDDWSSLTTRLINNKPVLMLPFEEVEEREEPAEDEYGNLIPKMDENGDVVRDEDGDVVYETKIREHKFVTAYFFEYSSNGSCKVLMDEYGQGYAHGWPKQEEEEEELPEEIKELQTGDYYIGGIVDLAKKGMPGYYLARSGDANNVYTIYNAKGEIKASFAVQSKLSDHPMIQEIGIIGNKMVFQVAEQVADDSENYDVFIRDVNPDYLNRHSGAKYVIESFSYDLLTGQRYEFDTDYYFKDITPIKGVGNGDYLYAVTFSTINETKTLNAALTYIIDKDLLAHDNITGFDFGAGDKTDPYTLKQLQDGKYYDDERNIVFSNALKPIVHLNGIQNLQYVPEHNVFLGQYNGKWGLVGTDGKVAAEFKYDSIDLDSGISGRFIARIDSDIFLVGDGKAEVTVGTIDEDPEPGESLSYSAVGTNGLYIVERSYWSAQEKVTYRRFFDTQSTDGSYLVPFATMGPTFTQNVYYETYDRIYNEYNSKNVKVTTNLDQYYVNDNLLGQYTLAYISNGENNYFIEEVPLLDEFGDQVKDSYGKLVNNEKVISDWTYTYTAIAPSNLKLKSYDSGEEALDAYYAAKDEKTAQVLKLGENEVLVRNSGATYLVFTPDKDNQPYVFTVNPEVTLGGTVTERWEETPGVIEFFAQYGDDTTLRINPQTNALVLTLELEESEPNPTAAQDADPAQDPAADPAQDPADPADPTYKPGKIDLKDLILHKVYNDKNEAQLRNVNSHMAISLEDVTIYELVKIEEPEADPAAPADPATPEEPAWSFPVSPKEGYEWKEFEGTEIVMDKVGTEAARSFLVVLKGTEPEKETDQDHSIKFNLNVNAVAADDEEAEELDPWDPTKEFNMITSEDEMAKNKKSKVHYITQVTNSERDEEGNQKPVSIDFYFGEKFVPTEEHEDEWGDGILKEGHDYYITLTSKQQLNNVEVKESHIHKIKEWLMGDIIIPARTTQTALNGGYKLGICEVGGEAIQENVFLSASGEKLTKEEAQAFLDNLGKDIEKSYGVFAYNYVTHVYDYDDPAGSTSGAAGIEVLQGLLPAEEIAKYNSSRKEGDPMMIEVTAEVMASDVSRVRLTAQGLTPFLAEYLNTEESQIETDWNSVTISYLYDKDFDVVDEEQNVTHTKAFYTIVATDDTNNVRFLGIYNLDGVLLYSSKEYGYTKQHADKVVVDMNMLYTEEFAQLILELYGI